MRTAVLLSSALFLVACAKTEENPSADSPAAAPAAPVAAPAPALSLASLTGKWTQLTFDEKTDSLLVTSEVTATADPAGWTLTLPNRPATPLKVTVDGDSLITSSGPYESVLRKGVQVTTNSVLRLQGDKLVGTTIAHYSNAGADSVRRLRTELTRKP